MEIDEKKLLGISLKTTNENGQSAVDIPALWDRFFREGIYESGEIYALYTEYEGDHTKPYRCFIGCLEESFASKPEGLEEITIPKGNYLKKVAEGIFPHSVLDVWQEVWQSDLPRAYTTDMEVYPNGTFPPEKVDIYIAIEK